MDQRDLIRIAHGPDTLLQTFCRKAKSDLGLSSNGFSLLNPISRPINIHLQQQQQPLSQSSPRNGFLDFSRNPNPNPLSPSLNPNFTSSPFGDGSSLFASSSSGDQFSFLNEHKRSFSASDVCIESEEEQGFGPFGPFGGYRFPQVDDFGSSSGGLSERDYMCLQREELMRLKLVQQQRMAATAKFMASACGGSASSMSHEKDINFLLQTRNLQRQGSGQFGEESGYYYSQNRHERDDSVSRQIYLTFPSESSFTDEDVSNYFSNFGTVEDVRIPYQQQRMYGFVTFANAETVRSILARGNPHFICDSRVLVKPYKEKGKILQSKRQMQQLQQLIERGNYSPSSSPSGLDSRDLYDCHLGDAEKKSRATS
ncbi:unnamed protein product [Arabis nemorensis]|uniref:RRM domain-containing protein n=1 Tax=Arabis nemorensis TaxID=586526 RepID=A0A565BGS5_9BRAS|nr:unnamed protein product [Arabis nemorensis]